MSLFHPVNLVCPNCDALITMDAVGSVNADRRPDLRQAIMEDHFQDITCASCNQTFRRPPEFNYLDAGRGQWIAGFPATRMPDYPLIEAEVADLFDKSYGKRAPEAAQSVGRKLAVRLTFGWPAIREKLLIGEHGLDDAVIEMLKLDLLRNLSSAPLGPGTELRLVLVTDDTMLFVWFDTATEAPGQQISVPRAAYDENVAAADGWAKTRARLEEGAFVDIQRLYMREGEAA